MFGFDESRRTIRDKDVEDSEALLPEANYPPVALKQKNGYSRVRLGLFIALSHCLFAVVGFWLGTVWQLDPSAFCVRHTSKYSPLLKEVDISYQETRFNGSFMKQNVFRQEAGPEVDAAWASIGVDYRAARVPPELAQKSGLASDQVKISQKHGGGYPANVEGLHHLHCLNLLRKALYYNYEYYHAKGDGAFKNEEHIVKVHVSHCLDIVRQQLMCSVDIGMLGQVWWNPEEPEPFVDFNTRHVCRNFEAIRAWAEKNQLPEKVPDDFLEPPQLGDRVFDEIP